MNLDHALFRISCVLSLTIFINGCANVHSVKSPDPGAAVRKVDFSKAPELKELAEHARQFGNEMYPKVCALFADEGAKPPRQFDIVLKPLKSLRTGETFVELRRITMNSMHLTNNPNRQEAFDKVLVHEMTHMALRHDAFRWSRPHGGWEEGLANYAYYKLIGTNGWGCPECDAVYPHYTSGYTCAGAFLLFVEAMCGSNITHQLNAELRRNRYSDSFFAKTTGRSLEDLWADFQKTSAFKPSAVEAFKLQQAIGYEHGEPPRNAVARFNKYVEQHANAFTRKAIKSANLNGQPVTDIQRLIVVYLYFNQPGGPAEQALDTLREQGKMPGFVVGEKGLMSAFWKQEEMGNQTFPATRTLTCSKAKDSSKYNYTLTRASQESSWKLEKAWRSAPDGSVIENYPVP